jgi:hypothetical protein
VVYDGVMEVCHGRRWPHSMGRSYLLARADKICLEESGGKNRADVQDGGRPQQALASSTFPAEARRW